MTDIQQVQCFEISLDELFVLLEIVLTDELVVAELHTDHGLIFQHYDVIAERID